MAESSGRGRSSSTTRAVLRVPSVRSYLGSRFFSSLARSLLHATIAWHLWKLTGSYFWLGVIGAVEFLPVIPVSLYAGAFADAHDRRAIVLTTQAISLLGALALAFTSGSGLAFERESVLAAAFVLATASSFENPAGASILPGLVPRELFASATVVSANVRNVASVSGPVLMGATTGSFGIPAAYGLTGLCLATSLLLLSTVRIPAAERDRAQAVSLAAIREGVGFVRRQPAILGSMTLDMFAVIFAGATAMLPVYADEILGVGEVGYGLLSASMQIGTMAMAGLLLLLPPIARPGRALLFSVAIFGAATIVFGLSRSFALSVAAFVLAGMADQVSMVARSIILQLSTPDRLRGRVNSVNMIFIGASNQLGAAESGFLAALTSATFSVVAGGIACLGALGIVNRRMPEIRRYRIGPPV
ncbi:MAG: MFS transporter [Myxococcota bacterium]|nr:MFS transporter [Myxococcota bacterium]